jgi:hypothetical protein
LTISFAISKERPLDPTLAAPGPTMTKGRVVEASATERKATISSAS